MAEQNRTIGHITKHSGKLQCTTAPNGHAVKSGNRTPRQPIFQKMMNVETSIITESLTKHLNHSIRLKNNTDKKRR